MPVVALLAVTATAVAGQVPPDAPWRSFESEHFRVTFPAGLESLARETAQRAERAYRVLAAALVEPPGGRTEILLTDYMDTSNGLAEVAPYKRITIFARPPVDGFALSHFDDWLELVVTHEVAHVFHLDVTGPLGGFLRGVFGRVPTQWPFFPGLGTPRWTVEGLATYYESALTESGRVRGSYHDMVLRTAILEGRFDGIDQVSGLSPTWPAGQRPYIYGSLFFDHLLDRYGAERMGSFVEGFAGQLVPYRLNAAARRAFGVSFSEAWDEWHDSLREELESRRGVAEARAPFTTPEAVTRDARFALFPRVSPDGQTLVYSVSDGRGDSRLARSDLSGGGADRLTRTNGRAVFDWTAEGGVVFSQLEMEDPYRMWQDLYHARPGGGVERVTEGARIDHPSVAPDGREVVAIQTGPGSTRLVAVSLADGGVRPLTDFDPEVHWAFPAVSPNGRWIAAARWSDGAWFDIVLLDREGGLVAEVTRDRALDVAPAWSHDGGWLLWASDRSGIPNILAARVEGATGRVLEERQVTNLLTGAHFPSVDPQGRWIYFSGYHADGWEVERIPYRPAEWFEPAPLDERFRPSGAARPMAAAADLPASDYNALATLRPHYWEPSYLEPSSASRRTVIGSSLGLRTRTRDLVGRHTLDVEVLASTSGARLTGGASYAWGGLGNPLVSVLARQSWDAAGPFAGTRPDGAIDTLWVTERQRNLDAGVTLLRSRFRHAASLTLGGGLVWENLTVLDNRLEESPDYSLNRAVARHRELSLSASLSTVRAYDFSVGPADGVSLFALARTRSEIDVPDTLRSVVGWDRSFNEVRARVALYRSLPGPGYGPHVLAVRASAGAAEGPGADRFHFDAGGASGLREPVSGLDLFGGPVFFFPARGYLSGERAGRYAASVSVEYRFPLALVDRGMGLFPLHLDRVSGALFFDGANAWGPELGVAGYQNPRRQALTSVGGEVVAEALSFFSIPLVLRTGLAVRLGASGGTQWYVRLGRSF
jgi:hypothetical protein